MFECGCDRVQTARDILLERCCPTRAAPSVIEEETWEVWAAAVSLFHALRSR